MCLSLVIFRKKTRIYNLYFIEYFVISFIVQMDLALSISRMALNTYCYCNLLRGIHKVSSHRHALYRQTQTHMYIYFYILYKYWCLMYLKWPVSH
jgi:hypothetical protein